MDGLFQQLDSEEYFVSFVTNHFQQAPAEIAAVMACHHTIDKQRVEYAYNEYKLNLEKFSVYLHSSNPDHYKRSGALLHSLYNSGLVVNVDLEANAEELATGFTRVNLGDAEHIVQFVEFYEEYHNQMLSFDLAYRCCAAYEENPRGYDFDYLHNMCRYLRSSSNLSVDSCFMIFKSLMM